MKYFYITVVFLASIMIGCGSGASSSSSSDSSGGGSGKGGSMARFAINGDKLYTLNNRYISVFDIKEADAPRPEARQPVDFDVETLYSYKKNLYVGAESGVYIYDENLTKIGEFTHTKSCDPVVVQDDVAFVTLNVGSTCRLSSGENTLQILDVKNPLAPRFITKKEMWNPKGLGIDGKNLFVCDGSAGLKVFDVNITQHSETNVTEVALSYKLSSSIADVDCYDVIAHKNLLIVSNGDDVRQFDYSHFPMAELGKIK
ncbi:MAG TPA: hypothetical protein EYG95_04935 [Campylobacterales bacterium]|nr:hypothetical protein [Campylobacterales bacterium]